MTGAFAKPLLPGCELDLTVEALVSDGRALGRHEGMAVFVENALPGQLVRARIVNVRKRLAEAELTRVLRPSPDELPSPCPHAGRCGGCPWQSLAYERQLMWKERIVRDALERVAKVPQPPVLPILPSPEAWGYRNKMEFAFGLSASGEAGIGLRERGSRAVVEVTGCLLQTPLTMRVLDAARGLVKGPFRGLDGRFLVIREPRAGGCFVELIVGPGADGGTAERFAAALREEADGVTGVTLSLREAPGDVAYGERVLHTEGRLEERIGPVRFQFGHDAFFQVNTPAAELLYAEAARFAALDAFERPVLWDVYGGVGSIGLYMAGAGARIVNIEAMPGAVRHARANAKALGVRDYRTERGDAKSVLGRWTSLGPKPDVIAVDPPRAGLDGTVARQLTEIAPQRLIYVSCNPATLARDVARLAPAYRLSAARPVDLFPQTPHVETAALLERV